MDLQVITNLDIDFYDKKYTLINAKQCDRGSRFLLVTCYSHGELFVIDLDEHSAYIRYKKSDGYNVYNFCQIDDQGRVLVELTEQMLASSGICYADLVIAKKGNAITDVNTGEIIAINNTDILSTMTFCIDVSEMAVDNSEIESTDEFNIYNQLLAGYLANYDNVMKTAKSWAMGETGIRDGEEFNNAKYYAELALKNAFGGSAIVTGVKGEKEDSYRQNDVNITAENVGAIPTADIATVDEIKTYLNID